MSNFTWILDPGHGGVGIGGEYLTKGKQSPDVPPGIYEGKFNREVAFGVKYSLDEVGIDCMITNPGIINIKNKFRTKFARDMQKIRKNCIFVSIHANAKGSGKNWNNARGTTIFNYPGDDRGKILSERLIKAFGSHTHLFQRGIHTSRFNVLFGTRNMPSLLVECGFMTHKQEASYLASSKGVWDIVTAITQMITITEMKGFLKW